MTHISPDEIADVLGEEAAERVLLLAEEADRAGVRFALVGGVVRDILLKMPTTDFDFVVDGGPLGLAAAAQLANAYKARFGGMVRGHAAFGTATWIPPPEFALDDTLVPNHLDIASARAETYEHPGALPIPAPTTLEDDLRRRDFTVNAIALMLAPEREFGVIVDEHGGLDDLDEGVLRVMHPDSFQDDPTRIFRGARLYARLGFPFDAETEALIRPALPVIDHVSGERLRTELRLMLVETSAPDALMLLDEMGALAAIHSGLRVTGTLEDDLLAIYEEMPDDIETAAWCAWLCRLDPEAIKEISVRLAFSAALAGAVSAAAALVADPDGLTSRKPSVVYKRLHGVPECAVIAATRVLGGKAANNGEKYLQSWRYYKTVTKGDTLKRLGIPPGPRYKLILQQILDARLDGLVNSESDETAFLRDLIDRLPLDGPA